jgi:signal transduction histidine kinase
MKVGAERIRQIVQSLRNFSRLNEAQMKRVNLHEGLDSTLLVVENRFKDEAGNALIKVVKDYSDLPKVECYPSQLNQGILNILNNAIDALESVVPSHSSVVTGDSSLRTDLNTYGQIPNSQGQRTNDQGLLTNDQGQMTIQIRTEVVGDRLAVIRIQDNGPGMSPEVKEKIFNPFFTTKPVGKGTGLGLSVAYQIIVNKHGGVLNCYSELGHGTEFVIHLPIRQPNYT